MKPVEVKRDDGVELETQVILRLPEVFVYMLNFSVNVQTKNF